MTALNGRLDTTALTALATAPGQRLRSDAAASWDRLARAVEAAHGWLPALTDSYRPYAVQERIFRERYQTTRIAYSTGKYDRRVWLGTAYWRKPGLAAAAVPGTSNHGLGLAVDVTALDGFTGTRFAQLAALAGAHGWDNTEGRSVSEAWHWTYNPAADTHPEVATAPPATTPTPKEITMLIARHEATGTCRLITGGSWAAIATVPDLQALQAAGVTMATVSTKTWQALATALTEEAAK